MVFPYIACKRMDINKYTNAINFKRNTKSSRFNYESATPERLTKGIAVKAIKANSDFFFERR